MEIASNTSRIQAQVSVGKAAVDVKQRHPRQASAKQECSLKLNCEINHIGQQGSANNECPLRLVANMQRHLGQCAVERPTF